MVDDHEDYETGAAPAAHSASHEDGGTDEISVAGLSGVTAELATHAVLPTVHQDAPALIALHQAVAAAHHVRYSDAEVTAIANGLIAAHAAIAAAHHARYTDAEAQAVADAQIATHTAIATAHQDAPALIATHAAIATAHQDAPALIGAHAALPSVHHLKYTDAEARAAINNIFGSDGKADSDIDLDTHKLVNVVDPAAAQDADTKKGRDVAISSHAEEHACRVYMGAPGQVISQNVTTLIEFDTEQYDTQNEFNTTTHRFTVKKAGKYLCSSCVTLITGVDNQRLTLAIYKTGVVAVENMINIAGAPDHFSGVVFNVLSLDVDDWLEVKLWQNSGGDQTVYIGPAYSYLAIQKF